MQARFPVHCLELAGGANLFSGLEQAVHQATQITAADAYRRAGYGRDVKRFRLIKVQLRCDI
jgi:hypothetical protein